MGVIEFVLRTVIKSKERKILDKFLHITEGKLTLRNI